MTFLSTISLMCNPGPTERSFRLTSGCTKVFPILPVFATYFFILYLAKKFDWAKAYCIWSTIYYSSLKIKLNSYFSTNRAVIVTNKAKLFISVTYRAKKLQKSNFVELTVKGN